MTSVPWTAGRLHTGGEDIAYEVTGDSDEVVVLCHGLGGNHAVWFQQVPPFAERYRVITWDQRGFGMSTNREQSSGPAAAVSDLGALLDHLDVPRAHLVGQSMGGWAVLGYALGSRDRVASLVICDSTAGVVNETINTVMSSTTRRSVDAGVAGAHPAIGPSVDATHAFLYQQIGSFRGNVDDAGMIARLFATAYPLDDIAALGLPALCVVGADDDLIPPAAVKEVAALLGARTIEIADAGHSPYFERPDAWNTAVLEFLFGLT